MERIYFYGGLPPVVSLTTAEQKIEFLKNLFAETYINDITGRHRIKNKSELEELLIRGFNVDAGVVPFSQRDKTGKLSHRQLEVDFVCNKASRRYYVQSAFAIPDQNKMAQEQRPFLYIDDSFKKIIITKDVPAPWYTEKGTLVMGIYEFLLNSNSLNE